jgi:PHD/YefM family antitoxin component YafN of YafNO toxin-antitoxin module
MSDETPTNQTVDMSEVEAKLDELVAGVAKKGTRVILEADGVPVAALVSPRDLERLMAFDEEHREARETVSEMRAAFAGIPPEEIEREAERAWADVKAEVRAERKQASATR